MLSGIEIFNFFVSDHLNRSSTGFTYCYSMEHKLQYNQNNVDVYGDSLVLLVQRSNFQTRKKLEAGADLFKYWCHNPWTFKVYSIK